jgi:hypothetical protein
MSKNLIAKNGTVAHAVEGNRPLCADLHTSSQHHASEAVKFATTTAPVDCVNCCRKLGVAAPQALPGAKKAKAALDTFEVGQAINTRIGRGTIVKLTGSTVTFTVDGQYGKGGKLVQFAAKRADMRRLNG